MAIPGGRGTYDLSSRNRGSHCSPGSGICCVCARRAWAPAPEPALTVWRSPACACAASDGGVGWGRGDWDADCDCDSDGVPMRLTSPLPSGLGGRMGGVPEYIVYVPVLIFCFRGENRE